MIVSSFSTTNLEDIARENPEAFLMFQLYIRNDFNLTKNMIKRAEKNGFKGIVLTVDTPHVGKRVSDKKNNFQLPKSLRIETLDADSDSESDSDSDDEAGSGESETNSTVTNISAATIQSDVMPKENFTDNLSHGMNTQLTWDIIKELKKMTSLPIIIKGISLLLM